MTPRRVWITRTQPAADATAARVRAMGHEPFVLPLLRIRRIAGLAFDLEGVAAVAFTSANAVEAFAAASPRRDLAAFAVGRATAAALSRAGFETVLSSEGGVSDLAQAILRRRGDLAGAVLHPRAADPAGDLAGALRQGGVEAREVVAYESVAADPAPDARLDILDDVLLHSPRAARILAEILARRPAPHLRALGLSPAVLEPLGDTPLAARAAAPFPVEAELLNLLNLAA